MKLDEEVILDFFREYISVPVSFPTLPLEFKSSMLEPRELPSLRDKPPTVETKK